MFLLGFGAGLALEAAPPDFMASPISLGALGAGAATSSSSSSSMMEALPSTLATVFFTLSFLFLPSAATGSMGVGFSVEALAFDIGCLPAGLLIFSPGFVP